MPLFAMKMNMITNKEALRAGVLKLQQAKIESASLDARILLEHALELSREQLLFQMEQSIGAEQYAKYQSLIARRADRRPVAQLIGRREFFGHEFIVSEATLDPRPDSETIVEAVLARLNDRAKPYDILDLGTGTGCLLLSLLKALPAARGTGADISPAALSVAKENTLRLGLQARTTFVTSHWCGEVEGRFDVIVANPPYIPSRTIELLSPEVARFEPKLALDGGEDGLDAYRALLPKLSSHLKPDGFAAFEIGAGQEEDLRKIVAGCQLSVAGVEKDLNGIARCVIVENGVL